MIIFGDCSIVLQIFVKFMKELNVIWYTFWWFFSFYNLGNKIVLDPAVPDRRHHSVLNQIFRPPLKSPWSIYATKAPSFSRSPIVSTQQAQAAQAPLQPSLGVLSLSFWINGDLGPADTGSISWCTAPLMLGGEGRGTLASHTPNTLCIPKWVRL
jgi:hypothetical protein